MNSALAANTEAATRVGNQLIRSANRPATKGAATPPRLQDSEKYEFVRASTRPSRPWEIQPIREGQNIAVVNPKTVFSAKKMPEEGKTR